MSRAELQQAKRVAPSAAARQAQAVAYIKSKDLDARYLAAERGGQAAGHAFTPRFGVADGELRRAA